MGGQSPELGKQEAQLLPYKGKFCQEAVPEETEFCPFVQDSHFREGIYNRTTSVVLIGLHLGLTVTHKKAVYPKKKWGCCQGNGCQTFKYQHISSLHTALLLLNKHLPYPTSYSSQIPGNEPDFLPSLTTTPKSSASPYSSTLKDVFVLLLCLLTTTSIIHTTIIRRLDSYYGLQLVSFLLHIATIMITLRYKTNSALLLFKALQWYLIALRITT